MKPKAKKLTKVNTVNHGSLFGELFLFEGRAVRVVGTPDNPLFVGDDVCECLGFSGNKGSDNFRPLEAEEKPVAPVPTGGGMQQMVCLTESGLYRLIFRSNMPEAKRFTRWVTGEVLPAIRKHGFYQREGIRQAMTRHEQTAYDEGKLARLMDERNNGQRARCPYRKSSRVRAWHDGYEWQAAARNSATLTPEQEANRQGFVDGINEWLRKNGFKK